VLGNSFHRYSERFTSVSKQSRTFEGLYIEKIQPYLVEWPLEGEFHLVKHAFNDTSLHAFPSELLRQAHKDTWELSVVDTSMCTVPSCCGDAEVVT